MFKVCCSLILLGIGKILILKIGIILGIVIPKIGIKFGIRNYFLSGLVDLILFHFLVQLLIP